MRPGKWPWTVSIIHSDVVPLGGHMCAGTLINDEWVLSAAHCFYNSSGFQSIYGNHIQVYAGNTSLVSNGTIVDVEAIFIHPDYDDFSSDNDIALIKLMAPLPMIPKIDLMPLDAQNDLAGNDAVVVGWGITEVDNTSLSADLMEVILPVVDHELCRITYADNFNITLTDNMICAGYTAGGKDSCFGDSGGPLMIYDAQDYRWELAGIVSWGVGCAEAEQYGVYTDARNYLGWIASYIDSPPETRSNDISSYIERLYLNILGRSSDPDGLLFWINEMNIASAASVSLRFFNSQEFLSIKLDNESFLDILYQTLFGRVYDSDGYNYWMSQLENGALREMVLYGFFLSQEFAELANRFNVTAFNEEDNALWQIKLFVERFYQTVLQREPDLSGFNYWVQQLARIGRAGGDIAWQFFTSAEFIKRNLSNEDFLNNVYHAFFDRAADINGQQYWLNQLSNGVTRADVVNGFINSPEFTELAAFYGISAR